jgi:DNA-binding IscR family transcriptional regulator
LARPAEQITMRDVIQAVDGPISVNLCTLDPEECERSGNCEVHKAWLRAQEQLMDVLGGVTLSSLAPQPVA